MKIIPRKERFTLADIHKQEKTIFVIFILAILFYSVFVLFGDFNKFIKVSLHFNWWIVIPVLILAFLNYVVRFMRSQYLLHKLGIYIPWKKSFCIFMSGISMTVTPGKMGEILKAYFIKKDTGRTYSELVPLLIFERVFDGIAMIILAVGGIFFFRQSILFFIFAISIVVGFFVFIASRDIVIFLIKKFEKHFFHVKLFDFALTFFEHSQKLLTVQNIVVSTFFGIIAWLFEGIALYWIINSFHPNLPLAQQFFYALFIFSFSSIAGFLVLIPGGVGVAEGSISSFLVLFFHLPIPTAVFIALLFRFTTLWFGVSLGLLFLFNLLKRYHLSQTED